MKEILENFWEDVIVPISKTLIAIDAGDSIIDGKPWWQTRRIIGAGLAGVGMITSVILGIDIPEIDIQNTTNIIEAFIATIADNKALLISVWGAVVGIAGSIFKARF